MFVSNREAFKAAVAACQERSGRELLDRLDLQEIGIEKVTEAELLHSCYHLSTVHCTGVSFSSSAGTAA